MISFHRSLSEHSTIHTNSTKTSLTRENLQKHDADRSESSPQGSYDRDRWDARTQSASDADYKKFLHTQGSARGSTKAFWYKLRSKRTGQANIAENYQVARNGRYVNLSDVSLHRLGGRIVGSYAVSAFSKASIIGKFGYDQTSGLLRSTRRKSMDLLVAGQKRSSRIWAARPHTGFREDYEKAKAARSLNNLRDKNSSAHDSEENGLGWDAKEYLSMNRGAEPWDNTDEEPPHYPEEERSISSPPAAPPESTHRPKFVSRASSDSGIGGMNENPNPNTSAAQTEGSGSKLNPTYTAAGGAALTALNETV
jgi:hypothetical protein